MKVTHSSSRVPYSRPRRGLSGAVKVHDHRIEYRVRAICRFTQIVTEIRRSWKT